MKITCTTLFFILFFLKLSFSQSTSSILVNKILEQQTGQPDTVDWSESDIDNARNIIMVGNTLVNGQGTNALITKYDEDGTELWQKTFNNSSNGNDYGIAVKTDGTGNIYVIAASYLGSTNNYDYNILEYNSSGILQWQTYYNGSGSSYDVPTALMLDASGNIYVTGTSVVTNNLNDYLTMKLNNSGVIQWTNNYDYVHLSDVPGAIELGANNRVIVSGGSSNSINDWDFTTVKYNIITGAETNVNRNASLGDGYDFATAIAKDAAGNFYITGKAYHGGDGYDIKTVKLDTALSTQWIKYYDLDNGEDGAWDIEVDGYNGIYVIGFVTHANSTRDMITIKYSESGTELWHRNYAPEYGFSKAEARRISVSPFDAIYVTGFQSDGNQSDIVTTSYDLGGSIRWQRNWIGAGGGDDIPSYIHYDLQKQRIYLTARTWNGTQNTYVNIWYEEWKHISTVETQGNTQFIADEVIVKFDPSVVFSSFVNNKELRYDDVKNVIESALLTEIKNRTGIDFYNDKRTKCIKVFKRMTVADTLSLGRTGITVKLDKLWSILVLRLPSNSDEQAFIDDLNGLSQIVYAERNGVLQLMNLSDDSYLATNQASLVPVTSFANAHINVNSAWDIEAGSSEVKVGVLDDAIYWSHEDFGDGTFAGSKIAGGHDYDLDLDISQVTIPDDPHGTASAGIIGALRFNDLGIAGIAGGDVFNDNNNGCTLYSLDIVNYQGLINVYTTAEAIVEGATYNPSTGYGYGLDILSIQVGRDNFWQVVSDAVKTCYDNRVVFIAARGNGGSTLSDDPTYPACLNPEWVVNVGGSGNNGFLKQLGINGDNTYSSLYGNNIDVLAPGSLDIVLTTMPDGMAPYGTPFSDPKYTSFTGTSAAAPHVAGAAALALSHHRVDKGFPNGLDDVDIQSLIKKSATDLTGTVNGITYSSGSDIYSGNGLLNAGMLMEFVNAPRYWVQHNGSFSESQSTTSNIQVFLPSGIGSLSAGYYFADRIQVTRTYSITVAYNSSTAQVIDHWFRHPEFGYSSLSTITDAPTADFQISQNGNSITVTITSYIWHITTNILGQTINKYLPFSNSSSMASDFSLHMYDPTIIGVEEIEPNSADFKVYPNPTANSTTVSFNLDRLSNVNIDVINISGQVVKSINFKSVPEGLHSFLVDLSELQDGIYFLKLSNNDFVESESIVLSR